MLSNAPAGSYLFPVSSTLANWIMSVPAAGGGVGVIIAMAAGSVSLSLRILGGIEKGWQGATMEEQE